MAEVTAVIAQATTGSSWVDTPVLSSPSESDAGRLADLLSAQNVQAEAPSSLSAVKPTDNVSMGDAILRSLDAAGRSYQEKSAGIRKLMAVENTTPLTTSDLLRMQFELLDTSMQVDLISKTISKGTQHIDQLTKLQ